MAYFTASTNFDQSEAKKRRETQLYIWATYLRDTEEKLKSFFRAINQIIFLFLFVLSNMTYIAYISNHNLMQECSKLKIINERAFVVHQLISAYKLTSNMKMISPRLATESDLRLFHAEYYVNYLKQQSEECIDDDDDVDDEQLEYGIGYDCPKLNNLWKFVTIIAGGTLTAVESIYAGANIAINWCGGWHHAQRDNAEGFCYVNDICIAIQKLREKFKRVLYIDLDTHHGNGVENAFAYTKRTFTLSFHQYEHGFFPNSGSVNECGLGQGRGYSSNFPYRSGVRGEIFVQYFNKVSNLIFQTYKPDVCIIQCGGDAIVGDPLGNTNLVPKDFGLCVNTVLSWNIPTIFLGGGGYNIPNTSRYWTYLTSIICKTTISDDIPDDENDYFLMYGPGYEVSILPKEIKDLNTVEEFEHNYNVIKDNLIKYQVCDI